TAIAGAAFVASGGLAPIGAQEGHPLTGTWSGDWGPSAARRTHVTLVMNWDGDRVTGTINPGPDAAEMKTVTVDVSTWSVHIEADGKDAAGKPSRIVADGKIEDLGSPHRRLAGTWSDGAVKGDFKVTRE